MRKSTILKATVILLCLNSISCKKTNSNSFNGLSVEYDTLSDATATFLDGLQDTTMNIGTFYLDDSETVSSFLQRVDPSFMADYPSSTRTLIKDSVSTNSVNSKTHSESTAILGTGITAADQLRLFITRMTVVGNYLITRSNFVVSTGQKNGLGYMTGSKDFDAPHAPPPPNSSSPGPGCQGVKLYGLDCSGLIYQMTTRSFLKEVVPKSLFGVKNINDTSKWNIAFQNSPDYDSLTMTDEGFYFPIGNLRIGDLIFWPGPSDYHIGIFIGGWIYESGGHASYPGCTHDLDPDKGPKFIPVSAYSQINGGRYQVFRPEILFPKPPKKLTGTYELTSLRMQATPGVVQMGQILDSVYRPLGDPEYWNVSLKFIDPPAGRDTNKLYYQSTSIDTAGNSSTYIGTYAIQGWQPDPLFLPVCLWCGYTENHPPYGWGYLFPPGFKVLFDFDADQIGRLVKDLSYFEVVQNGNMIFTKQ